MDNLGMITLLVVVASIVTIVIVMPLAVVYKLRDSGYYSVASRQPRHAARTGTEPAIAKIDTGGGAAGAWREAYQLQLADRRHEREVAAMVAMHSAQIGAVAVGQILEQLRAGTEIFAHNGIHYLQPPGQEPVEAVGQCRMDSGQIRAMLELQTVEGRLMLPEPGR